YRKNNRILDVGCGRGWFLIEAKKRGWEVYGTEYSKKAIDLCQMSGIEMQAGELNPNSFPVTDFDVITSFEVIEHIYTPQQELRAIYQLLRQGGLFYCTTPNFNSLLRYYLKKDYNIIGYPEHLIYFTKSTLNRSAKQQGFRKLKFLSTGISLTRFRLSKKTSTEKLISATSADEVLRRDIDRKWYLKLAKSVVNTLLTWTNTGMTLKGYYEKS
ncbi:MAG: class I SAM-dependent methyltransferase, partial [Bacteroidia bacterium]